MDVLVPAQLLGRLRCVGALWRRRHQCLDMVCEQRLRGSVSNLLDVRTMSWVYAHLVRQDEENTEIFQHCTLRDHLEVKYTT